MKSLEKALEKMLPPRVDTDPIIQTSAAPATFNNVGDILLNTSWTLFLQGNLPLSEIYVRWSLACSPVNTAASQLLESLRRGYGMGDDFELSERAEIMNREERYLLIKCLGVWFLERNPPSGEPTATGRTDTAHADNPVGQQLSLPR